MSKTITASPNQHTGAEVVQDILVTVKAQSVSMRIVGDYTANFLYIVQTCDYYGTRYHDYLVAPFDSLSKALAFIATTLEGYGE